MGEVQKFCPRTERVVDLVKTLFPDDPYQGLAVVLGTTKEKAQAWRSKTFNAQTLIILRLLQEAHAGGKLGDALAAINDELTRDNEKSPQEAARNRAKEIFQASENGEAIASIARRFGISDTRTRGIVNRERNRARRVLLDRNPA